MKAVNLIPADQRRAGSAQGRSGGAVYVVLGVLALFVALAGVYALTSKALDDKRTDLARTEQQAQAAEAKAGALKPYQDFATLRQQRVTTVTALAESRFDWAHTLHEIARTLPSSAWLSSLSGSTTQAAGSATTSSPSQSAQAPSVAISGCETSQGNVARLMSALRQIDGVASVTLTSSKKSDSGSTSTATGSGATPVGSGSGGCPARHPAFAMTITFKEQPAAKPAATTTQGATK